MKPNQVNCPNCEHLYTEGYKFCPHCGQKTNDELTIGVLFYNTISNYFSFDARFLKSFFPLMFRPGYLAKRFLEGKRLMYLHPAQMYLFVSVIFFFVLSFKTAKWRENADILNQKITKTRLKAQSPVEAVAHLDSTKKDEMLKTLTDNQTALGFDDEDIKLSDSILSSSEGDATVNWGFNKTKIDSLIKAGTADSVIYKEMGMSDNAGYLKRHMYKGMLDIAKGHGMGSILQRAVDAVPISMFVLLPLFAFILKLFYFKRGRYSHHLVFSFYLFSFLFTLFAILIALHEFVFKIPEWLSWLIVLSTYFYFYLALRNFYKRHWFTTLIKSSVITFIFMSFIIPTTAIVLIIFGFVNS